MSDNVPDPDDVLLGPADESNNEFLKLAMEEDLNNPINIANRVYHICRTWADFHLYITSPTIGAISPPLIIPPEAIYNSDEYEFVYPIYDSGYKLSTSKAEDMFSAGMSMCKLYYTIEKMIALLISRLKSGGISNETEVQIAFGGHELAKRKGFECIISLSWNVVVTNYDPGTWGEYYMKNVKTQSGQFDYPPETPRDVYKKVYGVSEPSRIRR